ncbi:heat shock 70 kDa protein 12A-like isoform X2 [Poeciliopsis prolifica]|uniref:heat shock 70 kDa protein 12A-like isoform X2 n=1 Tax=Poeciliopsis prolifica TaxID=188132 RepID=UPI0024136DA3|nr:heat shock 70 kDa protein 12A-like isoform X2 [Poeciliopsis prolifica]
MERGRGRKAAVHPTDMNFSYQREYSGEAPESDAESGYSSLSFRSNISKDFEVDFRSDRPSAAERLSEESDSSKSELSDLFKSNRFMRHKENSWNLPGDRLVRDILVGPSTQPAEAVPTMGDSFIIAIDFGTAYSGYAFSRTNSEDEIDPHLKFWGKEVGLETPKTPTCILFDKQQEFVSFGYVAKKDYLSKKGQEAKDMLFFDCFKMALYGKEINRDLMIKAANGKSMKALKVFAEALRFLKDDALETINSNTRGKKFIASDFNWVLTVPAIWDPSAKQFMREAAMQAGIVSEGNENKLVFALEPEAASVWCKKLPAEGFITQNTSRNTLDQSPGTQYIVVDCGGGTIDITVHEVLEGGALKELHKASGNDLGGQNVDRKFKQFLREIFCDGVWDKYEQNYPGEVQKIMSDFTLFKKGDKDMEITLSLNLGRLAQDKKKIGKFLEGVQGASWDKGSIKISKKKLRSFFDESLQGIVKSLDDIVRRGYRIGYILLVGGYADSQILQRHITEEYIGKCEVLCPFRPQEAILKGAMMFGRNPAVITSRKSAFTYGLSVAERFDASKHRADKKYTNQDGVWCDDIFMKLVEIDEDVGWNQIKSFSLYPTSSTQTTISYYFYRTQHKSPKYVDEEGVKKIGGFVLDSPNTERGMNREVKLNINFGFTEMKATATDIDSGSTKSIKLDFMRR